MALINTKHGPMEESLLQKKEGVNENENERAEWIEYWLNGELVHRSAHVKLKRMPVFAQPEAGQVG